MRGYAGHLRARGSLFSFCWSKRSCHKRILQSAEKSQGGFILNPLQGIDLQFRKYQEGCHRFYSVEEGMNVSPCMTQVKNYLKLATSAINRVPVTPYN